MSTEFGWWVRDPEAGKFQVRASFHGGAIAWTRQPTRFAGWEPHEPTDADWEQLLETAERRVPRRLLSPKQFDAIKRLREQAAS